VPPLSPAIFRKGVGWGGWYAVGWAHEKAQASGPGLVMRWDDLG
jgi:hypothetical protein